MIRKTYNNRFKKLPTRQNEDLKANQFINRFNALTGFDLKLSDSGNYDDYAGDEMLDREGREIRRGKAYVYDIDYDNYVYLLYIPAYDSFEVVMDACQIMPDMTLEDGYTNCFQLLDAEDDDIIACYTPEYIEALIADQASY